MIISLRGTNGAGKSTLVRRVIAAYGFEQALEYPPERRKRVKMGTVYSRESGRPLFVPGHYDVPRNPGRRIPNGGLDTMPRDLDFIYDLIWDAHDRGEDVLFEGRNREDSSRRLIEFHRLGLDARVVVIDVSESLALKSVRARGHDGLRLETIEKLRKKALREYDEFRDAGVRAVIRDRSGAEGKVLQWLQIEKSESVRSGDTGRAATPIRSSRSVRSRPT